VCDSYSGYQLDYPSIALFCDDRGGNSEPVRSYMHIQIYHINRVLYCWDNRKRKEMLGKGGGE